MICIKGEKDIHQVLKENATFISSLMLVLCVECKLHVFEFVKIYIMQLFLNYLFKGEIYSS